MKRNIITRLLIMMHIVCARLGMSDIESIGAEIFGKEANFLINPGESLDPLRGYIMHRSGYMYNKRFFTPEIDIEYSLEQKSKLTGNDAPIYKYTRDPVKDRVYDDICSDAVKNEYLIRFHKQLVQMFPSADGSLSIVAGRPNALYSFLIKEEVRPQRMYILAALFLLSEQVFIPIVEEITRKGKERRLVLRSIDGTLTYIDKSLALYKDGTKLKKGEKKWNTQTMKLIGFLKEYIAQCSVNPNILMRLPTEPTTYEQFMTGEFLNTPQFLVQSYIYEFIDTKDKYIEFVEAVYTLLTEQAESNKSMPENREKAREVFKRCFIKKSARSSVTDHTAIICDLKKTIDKHRTFPFSDLSQLPSYIRVNSYDRKTDSEIDDEKKKYSNCVETALLGLFCCLMYDPDTREYTTDHLSNKDASASLKSFFVRYKEPVESTECSMHQHWCRVVSDLDNKKIAYKKEKNEIRSGWINILYVIAEITGNKKEVLEAIECMEQVRDDTELSDEIDIEEVLSSMFCALSKNKNLEVVCGDLIPKRRSDNKKDVFGKVKLVYSFNGTKNGFLINPDSGHTNLHLQRDTLSSKNSRIIQSKLSEIHTAYNSSKTYTESIIKQYINIELEKMEDANSVLGNIGKKRIQAAISRSRQNLASLLHWGRISSVDHKAYIVKYFLMFYVNTFLGTNTPLVRLVNNIIGSVPLNDKEAKEDLLIWFVYNAGAKAYYPKIKGILNEFSKCDQYIFEKAILDLFTSPESYPLNTISDCFSSLMGAVRSSDNGYCIVAEQARLMECLVIFAIRGSKEPTKVFKEKLSTIKKEVAESFHSKLPELYLNWFIDLALLDIKEGEYDKEAFVRCLFDLIEEDCLIEGSNEQIDLNITRICNVLKYLNIYSDCLYNENDPNSIAKYEKIVSTLRAKKKQFRESFLR
ncbi:hypothetical protein NEIRO03_2282 [Nematocida sp. AWRm78]|nr:hypothetical protein NEIRO02_2406 [Nematocida sp. AWRm79]KAI5186411.1 hypothetical protein NEIRO03_2282 [Nematocida sp. AWRm78]